MTSQEMKKHLEVLEIKIDIEKVTINDVNRAFKRLAKVTHPDKTSESTTSAMQELVHSCKILRKYFKNNQKTKETVEKEDDYQFFEDNFEKFNFPFENKGSFTVVIEDYLANTWQECMTRIMREPKVIINDWGTVSDRIWKVMHGDCELTVHLYNKPKNKKPSKLMIQGGRQSEICSFVFDQLPKIYKSVCENKPLRIETKSMAKKAPLVNCDQCKFKSSMIQMKKHIKSIHEANRPKISKRQQNFTPDIKSLKRAKNVSYHLPNMLLNTEGIMDESILMLENNTLAEREITLDESSASNMVIERNVSPKKCGEKVIRQDALLSCDGCDFDSESQDELNNHKASTHDRNKCTCS